MDIDKKLEQILKDWHGDPDFLPGTTEAIKQAFKAAGYVKPSPLMQFREDNQMTGAYWYEKFVVELAKQYQGATPGFAFGDNRDVRYWSYREDVLDVAKKASGLKD